MVCAKCGGDAVKRNVGKGVAGFACLKCRGLFFGQGELAKHLGRKSDDIADDVEGLAASARRPCLACNQGELEERAFAPAFGLRVDRCNACEGIFLDEKELKEIEALSRRANLDTKRHVREDDAADAPAAAVAPALSAEEILATAALNVDPLRTQSAKNLAAKTFLAAPTLVIRQWPDLAEAFSKVRVPNRYELQDGEGLPAGEVASAGKGVAFGIRLGDPRGGVKVHDAKGFERYHFSAKHLATLPTPQCFTSDGRLVGEVRPSIGLGATVHEICDALGRCFASVHVPWIPSPRYPIFDASGSEVSAIERSLLDLALDQLSHGHGTRDTFKIEFGDHFPEESQRVLILLAAIVTDG